jgi:hypothetical protein
MLDTAPATFFLLVRRSGWPVLTLLQVATCDAIPEPVHGVVARWEVAIPIPLADRC